MTDISHTIERLLSNADALLDWQIAYLKSAANCEKISETQARVIQGMMGVKT